MISKKELLETIKILREAPMDYGDAPERINPDLEDKLSRKDTNFKDNPAIPDEEPEGLPSNFEELIASQRFKNVVEKVKRYTGFEGNVTSMGSLRQLMMICLQTLNEIFQFERENKEYLENLAIQLVRKEMDIPEDRIQYVAKIEKPDMSGFQLQGKDPSEEEIEQNFGVSPEEAADDVEEIISAVEQWNQEVAKRTFLNSMIQGAAAKGHYMFELVADELTERDPNIINKYGIVMSITDIGYWMFPDNQVIAALQANGNEMRVAGKEELDIETDPPTVIARGLIFPVVVHELIKGTMELMSTQGLPDGETQSKMVMGKTDSLASELWDLRLGPAIWEKFRESYPEKLLDEDMRHIQNYLFSSFSLLNAEEFFKVAKEILRGSDLGKQIVSRMVDQIIEDLKREDYEQDEFDREYGDESEYDDERNKFNSGLDQLLGDLDIPLSPDDDDDGPTV